MDEWHRGVEGLQSLGDILAQHDITLAIEPLNRYQTYFLNTIADALSLCEAVNHPNVGILFDVFHANIEEQDIPSAIRSISSTCMCARTIAASLALGIFLGRVSL
jgi:D-psicose/D-tagatose/L-ribulose 3-epimerase